MSWREYQARQRVIELDDQFVSYLDEGAGDCVVLLHGIPTWGYLWHGLVPTLARTHRVLVPDLLGFGYSDKADCFGRSIARQADWIDAWLGRLRIDRAAIVGHDIGGGVALRLATLHAGRVARLCVMNSVCYDSWPIELMLLFGHPGADRLMTASAAVKTLKTALRQGFATSPPDGLLDGLLAPYTTEAGKLSLIRDAAALDTNLTAEITPLLPRVAAPTMILWGEDDPWQPLAYGERLARDIPGARLEIIGKARHFVMIDREEDVARYLDGFLGS